MRCGGLPSAVSGHGKKQWVVGGASGAAAVKNGWLGASLRGYGDGGGGASSLQRCGEEEGREKRKEGAGRLGQVLVGLRPRPGTSWPV